MFRSLFGDGPALRPSRRSTGEPPPARFRPQVEALEDRTLAAFGASLAVSATTVTAGQPITLTASLLPGGLDRLDRVTFLDGTRVLGQKTGDLGYANHQLTVVLGVGTHSLTVRMEGWDLIPIPAAPFTVTSSAVAVQVNPAPVPVTSIEPVPGADVTSLTNPILGKARFNNASQRLRRSVTLVNSSGLTLEGPLLLVLTGLSRKVRFKGLDGVKHKPVGGRLVFDLRLNQLAAGQSVTFTLDFREVSTAKLPFTVQLVVGPG